MLFIVLLILIIFSVKDRLTKIWPFKKLKKRLDRFYEKTILNFFSRLILEGYLSYSLMCYIQLLSDSDIVLGELIGRLISGIFLTIFLSFPLLILVLSKRYQSQLKKKEFAYISTLFGDLRV